MRTFTSLSLLCLVCAVGCQCTPKRTPTGEPLVRMPDSLSQPVVWDTPASPGQDPSLKCAPCHREIVESYRATSKFKTSGVVESATLTQALEKAESIRGFSAGSNHNADLVQSESFSFGGRSAHASIQLGSANPGFAAVINNRLRLLPLKHNDTLQTWRLNTGYRGHSNEPFTTPIDENCSVCHGLDAGAPSFYGVSCDECHGNLEAHAQHPKAPVKNSMHGRLATPSGQAIVCGRCHTHVKAKQYGFQSQMLPLPSTAALRAENFRAYARDTVLDERIAGHQHRLMQSQCFENQSQTPRCSDCHDPHGNQPVAARTRQVCMNCHIAIKPCLDSRSKKPESDCSQCHLNVIKKKKVAHYNRVDHQIIRSKMPDVYWRTIPQTKLYANFTPVHSNTRSQHQAESETALFTLMFSSRPSEADYAALVRARQHWPSTESTLALMMHDLHSGQIDSARKLRAEYELVATLPDRSLLVWARKERDLTRYEVALKTLEQLRAHTQKSTILKLGILVDMKAFAKAERFVKAHKGTLLEHAEGCALLAEIEIERKQFPAALLWLRRSANMVPTDPRYSANIIKIHLKLGNQKSAMDTANQALRDNPEAAILLNLRGQIHYEDRTFHLAVRDWQKSLAQDSKQFETYARIMRAAIETGDRNTAATIFATGKSYMPEDPRWAELEKLLLKTPK